MAVIEQGDRFLPSFFLYSCWVPLLYSYLLLGKDTADRVIGSQTALSSSVLSLPTLVSPQLKTPLYSVLCTSQTISMKLPSQLGCLTAEQLCRVLGVCANPPRQHRKAIQGHTPHVCSQPGSGKSRALFPDSLDEFRNLPQLPSESCHALGDKSDPSGQFGILQ